MAAWISLPPGRPNTTINGVAVAVAVVVSASHYDDDAFDGSKDDDYDHENTTNTSRADSVGYTICHDCLYTGWTTTVTPLSTSSI